MSLNPYGRGPVITGGYPAQYSYPNAMSSGMAMQPGHNMHPTPNALSYGPMPALDVHPGDLLVAEGTLHAGLKRPLPPAGELDVALVLRRRAVLDRLVAWQLKGVADPLVVTAERSEERASADDAALRSPTPQ